MRLADELWNRELGGRPVVAYERDGAASCLEVELKRAVRPMLRARDGGDGVAHHAAVPRAGVAQPGRYPSRNSVTALTAGDGAPDWPSPEAPAY